MLRAFKPRAINYLLLQPKLRPFSAKMGAIGQHTVHTTERLANLRELMKQKGLGAFVVLSEDQRMLTDPSTVPIYLTLQIRRKRVSGKL
jgi:hypothetical protein